MNAPDDLKYTKTHEWVRVDGDTVTIGITDHAQSELGDIVHAELPEAGRALALGDSFGEVESVKTVSEIYSPISGEVAEKNEALGAQAELINTDPYGDGWLIKIKTDDPSQADALMDAEAYKGSIE